MFPRKIIGRFIFVATLGIATTSTSIAGGIRFAVEPPAQFDVTLDQAPNKLAPELRVALSTNTQFVGINTTGRSVLEFADTVSSDDAESTLAEMELQFEVADDQSRVVPVTRLIVFVPNADAVGSLRAAGFNIGDYYAPGGFALIQSSNNSGFTPSVLRQLINRSDITYIEPNFPIFLTDSPNPDDYDAKQLWGLDNANVDDAWKQVTSSTRMVAVIDTGIDYRHPDLKSNMAVNDKEMPGNGKDDDNNGYIDDVYGYDFYNDDGDPLDGHSHGTHCAGTIGAVGNNGTGIVGVVQTALILPVQIFSKTGSFSGAEKTAKAIDYAVKRGVKILSNSWSGPNLSAAIKGAIDRAEQADVLFIAAAGNNYGNDNDIKRWYPASYSNKNIISVASIDEDEKLSSFSNVGKKSVDLVAPGSKIYSTIPNAKYDTKNGTSMATPHVAGAVALVWNHHLHRNKSATDIRKLILANVRKLPSLKGKVATEGTLDLAFLASDKPAIEPSLIEAVEAAPISLPTSGNTPTIVTGTVSMPHFALGGETTGIAIQRKNSTIQIDAEQNQTLLQKSLKLFDGEEISIEGFLSKGQGLSNPNQYFLTPKAPQ